MKKIALLSLMTIVFIGDLVSQAPNLMSYQAVIWDASGNLVSEKTVSIKISILQGSVTGTSVYSETHSVQTNVNGLVSLMIGGGTNTTGKIAEINWGAGSYFLKTETDPTGGGNYSISGISQLMSVPFSFFSGMTGNIQTTKPGLPGQVLKLDEQGKPFWSGSSFPIVSNQMVSLTSCTASITVNVSDDGGSPVTSRGVVWSTSPNPTITSSKVIEGNGKGSFSTTLLNLAPNTTYYIRAFATNEVGTGYGSEIKVTTFSGTAIPTVTTIAISEITSTTAKSGGIVTGDCGSVVTARGVVWSTNTNPTISLTTKTSNGTGTGSFSTSLSGLSPNNTYYVRAYATNSAGTGYGNEITFNTSTLVVLPTVSTILASSITTTSAITGGNITSDGGASITTRGVVWSTNTNPTISLTTKTSNGTGTGSFSTSLSGLSPNTTYYVRAYATSSAGTGYGNEMTFKTGQNCSPNPVLIGSDILCIGSSTAISSNILGGIWSSSNPNVATVFQSLGIVNAISEGFTEITYLIKGINGCPDVSSKFPISIISKETKLDITGDNFVCEGNTTFLYSTIYPGYLKWSIQDTFIAIDGCVFQGGPSGPTPIANQICIKGKKSGLTTITFKYGGSGGCPELSVTRQIIVGKDKPTVTRPIFNDITSNSAKGIGEVIAACGSAVTARGIVWSTSPNTTIALTTKTSAGIGTGSFTSTITGLSPNTTYYYRAYAINSSGIGYSDESTFTTKTAVALPVVSTVSASSITPTTASLGGNVTSDGGSPVTARGVVWSTNTNPTISLTTKTSNGSGTGSFISSLSGLTPSTTYYVRAYATNSAGTGYGNEVTFSTSNSSAVMNIPCPGTPSVKDIDGNTYNTVQIGTQCWTKENLKVTKYRNGNAIPTGLNNTTWSSTTSGAYAIYDNDNANDAVYGKLYNWYAVNDNRGLCPTGWHISTDAEWTILTTFLGQWVSGGKLKSTGTTYWKSPNLAATNESGFSALPGGYRYRDGRFIDIRNLAYFWITNGNDYNDELNRFLAYNFSYVSTYSGHTEQNGFSVRCLKDINSIVSPPTLTTNTITAITSTSATAGGNFTTDGGVAVISRGVVWSTSPNPTITLTTKTNNGTGIGSFTSSLTNLSPNTTYYVRAYATNSAGTGYGNEVTFTTSTPVAMNIPCPGISSISDIDGNSYNTVQIGTQCWTKENLKVTKYRDGTSIPTGLNNITWENTTSGAYAIYDNSNVNDAIYGKLYNWYAVRDSRGLCPTGWHVPTDAEWTTLTNYLGGEVEAGGEMKSMGTTFWQSPNTGATNESGFSGLPGGTRFGNGNFLEKNYLAFFWTNTEKNSNSAWIRSLINSEKIVERLNGLDKLYGNSVRCLRD
jgi:uncharacterized protein (TIGR02145 family)